MRKNIIVAAIALSLIPMLYSCSSSPTACFQVLTPADSIRVGYGVRFSSSCSSDATKYYWDFGNGQNSSSGGVVQAVYDTTGTFSVSLISGGNGKSASTTKTIIVL